jgi:hypothetical protein
MATSQGSSLPSPTLIPKVSHQSSNSQYSAPAYIGSSQPSSIFQDYSPILEISSTSTKENSVSTHPAPFFRQMTIVVINAVHKEEGNDEGPWEDGLIEYLTDEGKIKNPNDLASCDFSLAKLKSKLADLPQSLFGFDEVAHQLVSIGVRKSVVQYERRWRTILQSAGNKGKCKIVFNVHKKP